MIITSPGSVAFEIWGFPVYFYGIIMAFAIIAGTLVADRVWIKYYSADYSKDTLLNLAPCLIIMGFLGARLYYCLVNFEYYSIHPAEIFNIRQGGLSIHGMFFICFIFLILCSYFKKINLWKLTASMSLGIALAQSVGRWGNFFNSEAFGRPYDGFLKLYISPQYRPLEYADYSYFHPTFLWESLLDLGIFVILFFVFKRTKGSNPLFISSLYFLLYGLVRIFVEYLRVDSALYICNMPIAVFVSVIILVLSLIGIIISSHFFTYL